MVTRRVSLSLRGAKRRGNLDPVILWPQIASPRLREGRNDTGCRRDETSSGVHPIALATDEAEPCGLVVVGTSRKLTDQPRTVTQAKIVASNHFNLSSVTTVAFLFVVITIPQARFVDRLMERDQRRMRAGG